MLGQLWTVSASSCCRKLVAENLTASQIAAEIGGVTRNSIIGKVHRLGISLANARGSLSGNAHPRRKKARLPYLAQTPVPKGKVIGRIARGGTSPKEIIVYEPTA